MSPEGIAHLVLERRGIPIEEYPRFLEPDFQRDLFSPLFMVGMDVAVDRLLRAHATAEPVTVFGDYDADGVPATAVMVRGLQAAGFEVRGLIPKRTEGYGLNGELVDRLLAEGVTLLITVDNGTVAINEIARLRAAGVDVIVCDHHEPQAGHLATATAILNPKQVGDTYPFKELCGCAIAWKLLWGVYERLKMPIDSLKWLLDLVALATVADMVPLKGENRSLVHFGLKVLHKTRNTGLQALAAVAGVTLAEASATDIGFRLAPRLNAPSRMHRETLEDRNVPLTLLLSETMVEAEPLAHYLNECNAERQRLLEVQLAEACAQAETASDALVHVVYGPEWSSGVIGLVAGRLVEKYKRPALVLADEGGKVKGSVRSVDGVHVVELLKGVQDHLERYGGHAKAGGLTLKGKDVTRFQAALALWAVERGIGLNAMAATMVREADADLNLPDVTLELAHALAALEPYGLGFERPLFRSNVRLENIRIVGVGGKHLSCQLKQGRAQVKGIGFGLGGEKIELGKEYMVWYTVRTEEWQGKQSLSCQIERIES